MNIRVINYYIFISIIILNDIRHLVILLRKFKRITNASGKQHLARES